MCSIEAHACIRYHINLVYDYKVSRILYNHQRCKTRKSEILPAGGFLKHELRSVVKALVVGWLLYPDGGRSRL